MTKQTEARWAERIREWRESGLSAEEFAEGQDFEASSLRWAASQLQPVRTSPSMAAPRPSSKAPRHRQRGEREPTSPSKAPRFLPVRMRGSEPLVAEMIVEVGGARIRVPRGVDASLLGEVVRALHGVGR
jgi:transposase